MVVHLGPYEDGARLASFRACWLPGWHSEMWRSPSEPGGAQVAVLCHGPSSMLHELSDGAEASQWAAAGLACSEKLLLVQRW